MLKRPIFLKILVANILSAWVLIFALSDFAFGRAQCEALWNNPVSTQQVQSAAQDLVLYTQRLILKPLTSKDSPEFLKLMSNPQINAMSGTQYDEQYLIQLLEISKTKLHEIKSSRLFYIVFGIYLDEKLVGEIHLSPGLNHINNQQDYGPRSEKWLTMGMALLPEYWGRGFATEVNETIVHFAFDNLYAVGLHAQTAPTNTASQNVLVKVGFQKSTFQEPPFTLFFMNRERYRAHYDRSNVRTRPQTEPSLM